MIINGYYKEKELKELGLKSFGKNVLISKDARIFHPDKFSVGNNVRIDAFCIFTGEIELGDYVHIGSFCALYGRYGIKIGNFSGLSSRVSIYTTNEDYVHGSSLTNPTVPLEFRKIDAGKVIIGDHCPIGSTTVILPRAHLKEGVAIGAFSLVTKGIYDSWHLFSGIPAKRKRERPREIILRDAKKLTSTNKKTE